MKIGSEFGAKTFHPTGDVPKDINVLPILLMSRLSLNGISCLFFPQLQPNKGQEGNTYNQQFWAKLGSKSKFVLTLSLNLFTI